VKSTFSGLGENREKCFESLVLHRSPLVQVAGMVGRMLITQMSYKLTGPVDIFERHSYVARVTNCLFTLYVKKIKNLVSVMRSAGKTCKRR